MKCKVAIAHPAHTHPRIGYCPGISTASIMRRVESQRTDAFALADSLSRKIGLPVSASRVRRDLLLWRTIDNLLWKDSPEQTNENPCEQTPEE